ncbi:siderophore-interacting protein [Frankia sp. AiPs1]|uniref:siderophore-interacting protein n=1 Tax=Frankia sp. AiPs1 TaxID=573493 RepID=UPI0020434AF4|nr:siderophore-interacting protein [Frankia sp. AiPs1]MCM3922363.1 siderophore-interacting protein [Frankia sp. AiPs1]
MADRNGREIRDGRTARRVRKTHRATVLRTERVSEHMVRVMFGGDGLAEFVAGEHTDHYVKLLFPVPGVTYPEPMDIQAVRQDLPREQWPRTRTYTVRSWNPDARELTIDFVYHGERGVAGPWAAGAQPGAELSLVGPGGGYAPDVSADWHLLAGDESALPAIAASLARMPGRVPVAAFVEVAGPGEEQVLDVPAGAHLRWLHRGGREVGETLVEAVSAWEFPPGDGQAFVHGEAGAVKRLRHLLRIERGMDPARLSISGYWRLGSDEDGWQASKTDWNRQIEAEEQAAVGS